MQMSSDVECDIEIYYISQLRNIYSSFLFMCGSFASKICHLTYKDVCT